MSNQYKAVIFDLGGVVFDSPLKGIYKYERELNLPRGFFSKILSGEKSSFARLENGELSLEDFSKAFENECRAAGAEGVPISGTELMKRIYMQLKPRKEMISTIAELKQKGFKTAAITNNWKYEYETEGNNNSKNNTNNINSYSNISNNNNDSTTGQLFFNKHHHKFDLFRRKDSSSENEVNLSELFDVIVESYKVGIRKPDPKIYDLALEQLNLKPHECIFLDDLGINLKYPKKIGMFTIRVDMFDYVKALNELAHELGIELRCLQLTAKL
eukprot:TRINITY_DN8777_c0_g1_i1.p1 TRINITY_DN8777_c0_g1~~TRINITY_DN8777_c0_g1_i1.p1  ORF type:complete len:272 (-),score=29.34 TRINITY_DN8777_c0_g1_i1:50-865(-)